MANDPQQWGVVGGMVAALLAAGRLIWRWERTFSDAARAEIVELRKELNEVRSHVAKCEADNLDLRRRIADLEARRDPT